jgi:peptide chain release factor 1
MNLALKLDRIAARADELRAMLSEGVSGEAYVKASRELADIEPVVARIGDLRAAERAQAEAEALLADPEMKELAEAELYTLKTQIPELEHEIRLALLPKDEADARSASMGVGTTVGTAATTAGMVAAFMEPDLAVAAGSAAATDKWAWRRNCLTGKRLRRTSTMS